MEAETICLLTLVVATEKEFVLENPIVVLMIGIVIGVMLTAKPISELVYEINRKAPAAFPYAMLGFLLFLATLVLDRWGFAVVITVFVLYQIVGKGKITLPSFDWPKWLKRKPKTIVEKVADVSPSVTSPVLSPDAQDYFEGDKTSPEVKLQVADPPSDPPEQIYGDPPEEDEPTITLNPPTQPEEDIPLNTISLTDAMKQVDRKTATDDPTPGLTLGNGGDDDKPS